MIVNPSTWCEALRLYIIDWNFTRKFDWAKKISSTAPLEYYEYSIRGLATEEPNYLLQKCEDGEYLQNISLPDALILNGFPTNVDCDRVESTGGELWDVRVTLIVIPTDFIITEVPTFQSFDLNINMELGSPWTASLTAINPYFNNFIYDFSLDPGDSLTIVKEGNSIKLYGGTNDPHLGGYYPGIVLFTGFVTDVEKWEEKYKSPEGIESNLPALSVQLVDATKLLSEYYIVGPVFLPGDPPLAAPINPSLSYCSKPFRDGSDHVISVRMAATTAFYLSGLGITFPAGSSGYIEDAFPELPTNYGFHSGTQGERTWVLQMSPLSDVVNTIYELTGLHCWAGLDGLFHFGGGGGTIYGLKYKSTGATDANYRATIIGYGGNGITAQVGTGGRPYGYFIEDSITDVNELTLACEFIWNQCKQNYYKDTYTGKIMNIIDTSLPQIPGLPSAYTLIQPGGNLLSLNLRLSNSMGKFNPEWWGQPVSQAKWVDEVTVVMGRPKE